MDCKFRAGSCQQKCCSWGLVKEFHSRAIHTIAISTEAQGQTQRISHVYLGQQKINHLQMYNWQIRLLRWFVFLFLFLSWPTNMKKTMSSGNFKVIYYIDIVCWNTKLKGKSFFFKRQFFLTTIASLTLLCNNVHYVKSLQRDLFNFIFDFQKN